MAKFNGTSGPDVIPGTTSDDQIYGEGGNDLLSGDDGNDLLDGGTGVDVLDGGLGNDRLYVDSALDQLVEAPGGGSDILLSSVNYVLADGVSVEGLSTRDWSATTAINLTGNNFENLITGNAGANILNGGGGADVMQGFAGDDRYYLDNVHDRIIEASNGGNDILLTSVSYTLADSVSVESLSTADWSATTAINLTGNSLNNIISGNAGDNILNGGTGIDAMQGFGGNDRYYVDNLYDRVFEDSGGGTDIILTSVTYVLTQSPFVEDISTADWSATTPIHLIGNGLNNHISGNAGDNILDGAAGADVMQGFAGDDRYYVDNALDRVIETSGGGADEIRTALVSFSLAALSEVENLTSSIHLPGKVGQTLTGNALDNEVTGSDRYDVLIGGAGNDILTGGGGNDRYYVDSALDQVLERSGGGTDIVVTSVSYVLANGQAIENLSTADWSATTAINLTGNEIGNSLAANAGANLLDGGGGNDTLAGLDGVDTLLGGIGNDSLFGGLGADSLTGGAGTDRFRFDSALGGDNVDTITDFTAADDVIWLDDAVFTGLPLGVLAPGAFATGTAAADADDRIIYDTVTGALLFDADGAGGVAAVQFATLSGAPAITAADFVVV